MFSLIRLLVILLPLHFVACHSRDGERDSNAESSSGAEDKGQAESDAFIDVLDRANHSSAEASENTIHSMLDAKVSSVPNGTSTSETSEMADSDSHIPSSGPSKGTIRYIFAWNLDGIERRTDGSWSVTNDLGYRLDVEEGYLVTYQASLVPCNEMGMNRLAPPWYERILNIIMPMAHAGHGALDDPSALPFSFAESMTTLDTTIHSVMLEADTRYCDVHYLVSQADFGTEGLPLEPELDSISLILSGSWSHPELGTTTPITVNVDIAYGVLQSSLTHIEGPLKSSPISVGPSHDGLDIKVIRHLGTAFDEIQFDAFVPRAIGRRILKNLVTKASLTTHQ